MNKLILFVAFTALSIFIFNLNKPSVCKIHFDACNTPIIEVSLESKNYNMLLDLGARTSLSICKEELEKLNKMNYGSTSWVDAKGNRYTTQRYLLPKVKLQNMPLYDVFTEEEPPSFSENARLWDDEEDALNPYKSVGRIGYSFIKKMQVVLDFPKAQALFYEKGSHFSINPTSLNALAIPFKSSRYGIVVSVQTDLGEKRFLIDTGSTITLVKKQDQPENIAFLQKKGFDVLPSSIFVIEGQDFGSQELYFCELSAEFHYIDGIIGMDFLKKRMLFLDFEKNILYLK